MDKKSRDVLEYLYKHKVENGIESISSLIQLPNIDGIQDLYQGGYVDITRAKNQSIKTVFITGKGIDWIKEDLSSQDKPTETETETQISSEVSISSDVISIKILDEIYGHIKSFFGLRPLLYSSRRSLQGSARET